jgi:integrase
VLNSVARRIVEARLNAPGEFVFASRRAPRMHDLHGRSWVAARKRAGVPWLRVHDLRHTFGHRLRAAGVSFEDRADLLGHAAGK